MGGWRIFSVGGGVPRDLTDWFQYNLRLRDKGARVDYNFVQDPYGDGWHHRVRVI